MAKNKKYQKEEECVYCDDEKGLCDPIDCDELLEKTKE